MGIGSKRSVAAAAFVLVALGLGAWLLWSDRGAPASASGATGDRAASPAGAGQAGGHPGPDRVGPQAGRPERPDRPGAQGGGREAGRRAQAEGNGQADEPGAEPGGGFVLGPADDAVDGGRPQDGARPVIHCAIHGTVRLDGEPQAGVEVNLWCRQGDGSMQALPTSPARTDPDGRFTFAQVAGNSYRISVTHQRAFSKGLWIVCQNDGEDLKADVDLQAAGVRLHGRITDRDGNPLAQSWALARRPDVTMASYHEALAIPVDGTGHFEAWLPDDEFQVVSRAVGHQGHVLSLPKGEDDVELIFRLERQSSISGVVIGPDGPQADARVAVSTKNDDGSSEVNSTDTGADGRFDLVCGPGEAEVTAWHEKGWDFQVVPARHEATDAPDVVLRLKPGRTITGHVHLRDGKPAPMVSVGCHSLPSGVGGVVQADLKGDFRAPSMPRDERVLIFCLRDTRPWSERKYTLGPDQDHAELLFVPAEE